MLRVCGVLVVLGLACSALAEMNSGSDDNKCSFSSGSSVTISVGEIKTVFCVNYTCELDSYGNPAMKSLTEPKCSVTDGNGVEHCLAAGDTESCTTCVSTNPVTVERKCGWNGGCLDGGEEQIDGSCIRHKCNSTTWSMDTFPRDKCNFVSNCYEGGQEKTHDCADYICNAQTWSMDEKAPKNKCTFGDHCVTEESMEVIYQGATWRCKCVNPSSNSVSCKK